MSKAVKILSQKKISKIPVPVKNSELHDGLDRILSTRTMGKAFGEILLQALYLEGTGNKAQQVAFASRIGWLLDDWAARQRGAL
jgi:hypothetical protein